MTSHPSWSAQAGHDDKGRAPGPFAGACFAHHDDKGRACAHRDVEQRP
jgi:hypothetical protein